MPGAVLAVGSSTKTHLIYATGALQLEPHRRPMTEDAIFDLASLTKVVVTTTGILLLVERGCLALDQPLTDVYPHWRGTIKEAITVRHLLTHTSGLPAWQPLYVWGTGKERVLETIGQMNLHGAPGAQVEYSCLGFIVLGHIIETCTGQSLDEFFREEIAGPLGMRWSGYLPLQYLPEDQHHRLVPTERGNEFEAAKLRRAGQLYPHLRTGYHPGQVHDGNAWYALGGISGNAGLFGTAEDLLLFAQMWLRALAGSARELISPAMARLSIADHTPGFPDSRGLGWQRQLPPPAPRLGAGSVPGVQHHDATVPSPPVPRACGELFGPRSVGHTGFTGTSLWLDPDADLAVVLLTSRLHPVASDHIFHFRPRVHNAVAAAASRL
ncbi:MAG: beta-lactamase family protein [Limnochordales bacterium]